jgi:hypothetical protein
MDWADKIDLLGQVKDDSKTNKLVIRHLCNIEQQNNQTNELLEHIAITLDNINKNGIASF